MESMTLSRLRHSAMVLAGLLLGIAPGFAGKATAQPLPSVKPLPPIEIMPVDAQQGLRVAPAPRLEPCPLFLGLDDPAHCHLDLSTRGMARVAEQRSTASTNPATLLSLDDAMLGVTGDEPLLAPPPTHRLGLTVSGAGLPAHHEAIRPGSLQTTYDMPVLNEVPLLNRFNITGSSKVSRTEDAAMDGASTASARSRLGLAYEEYGVRWRIDPDVSASWGELAAGQMQYGITNQIATDLARDLTLTLTSSYNAFSYPGEPLRDHSAARNRIALSYAYGDGYKLGLSAHSRNEQNHWENRNLIGPGLSFTVPLSGTFSLTGNSEFSLVQRDLHDAATAPLSTYQQSFGLQTKWQPAALASHALSIVTGYTLNYDSAPPAGLASYTTLARVALAMRF
jgi:hypothetical protein